MHLSLFLPLLPPPPFSPFRYNSGAKEFKEIHTKSLSLSVDAITIKNDYWNGKKFKPPLGAFR